MPPSTLSPSSSGDDFAPVRDAICDAALAALPTPNEVAACVVNAYADKCANAIRSALPGAITAALTRAD